MECPIGVKPRPYGVKTGSNGVKRSERRESEQVWRETGSNRREKDLVWRENQNFRRETRRPDRRKNPVGVVKRPIGVKPYPYGVKARTSGENPTPDHTRKSRLTLYLLFP